MKTRFRIKQNDSLKAHLLSSSGKLLVTLYDSGFTRLDQVYDTLLNKCCNPPRGTKFTVYNQENGTYWSNT